MITEPIQDVGNLRSPVSTEHAFDVTSQAASHHGRGKLS